MRSKCLASVEDYPSLSITLGFGEFPFIFIHSRSFKEFVHKEENKVNKGNFVSCYPTLGKREREKETILMAFSGEEKRK